MRRRQRRWERRERARGNTDILDATPPILPPATPGPSPAVSPTPPSTGPPKASRNARLGVSGISAEKLATLTYDDLIRRGAVVSIPQRGRRSIGRTEEGIPPSGHVYTQGRTQVRKTTAKSQRFGWIFPRESSSWLPLLLHQNKYAV